MPSLGVHTVGLRILSLEDVGSGHIVILALAQLLLVLTQLTGELIGKNVQGGVHVIALVRDSDHLLIRAQSRHLPGRECGGYFVVDGERARSCAMLRRAPYLSDVRLLSPVLSIVHCSPLDFEVHSHRVEVLVITVELNG